MSAGEKESAGLIRSQSTELSRSGTTALTARGCADLRKRDEAEEWLRKGLELQRNAFNDPGWLAAVDPRGDSDRRFRERCLLASEYLERVRAGENSDLAAATLDMSPEDRELARTIDFFFPSCFPAVAEVWKKEREKQHPEIAKHEERMKEAFRCFQRGLDLDPNNLELINNLADCYSAGHGVEEDEEKELALLRKAAEMGDFRAQTALGYHYSGGLGGGPDGDLAVYWFRKAAEQGDEIAIRALRKLNSAS